MRIDPDVEAHLREAFAAVIAKDGDRMVTAFRGLDQEQSVEAARYAIFVVGFVVNDVFRKGWTEKQVGDLAAKVVQSEGSWIDLGSADEVARLLDAAGKGDLTFPGVPREDVMGHIVVCGAFLLTSFRLDGQHWWDYLNEVWEAALAAPDTD